MSLESLRLLRNILLRSALIGFLFGLIFGLTMMLGWKMWMGLLGHWFHTDQSVLTPIVLSFFTEIRFFIVFILLTPGLAIHWTLKRELARAR